MRRLVFLALLAGCGNDLCDGISGACVDLTVEGSGRIDTLRVHASSAGFDETRVAPGWATPTGFPVYLTLALRPQSNGKPNGNSFFTGGLLNLEVTGLEAKKVVGVGTTQVTLGVQDHKTATVRLGGSLEGEDLASLPSFDLARRPDLSQVCHDTGSDPHNCGDCGHDCLGGGCQGGQCQPMLLAVNTSQQPVGIAVDAANVYWVASGFQGGVWRQPLAGGAPVQMWPDSSKIFGQMTLSDGNLYFAVPSSGIWTLPTSGTSAVQVIPDTQANSVASDGSRLYWGRSNQIMTNGAIDLGFALPIGNCGNACTGLASDGTILVSAASGNVQELTLPNGSPSTVSTILNTFGVALDSKHYYVAVGVGIVAIDRSSQSQETLVSAGGSVRGVAVDADAVYFTNFNTGAVSRVAKPIGF